MGIICCNRCRKIFDSFGSTLCYDCQSHIENCYEKVRKYAFVNQSQSVYEIAEATGVEEKLILSFVKEGKLSLMAVKIHCAKCGAVISQGTYCEECIAMLQHGLMDGIEPVKDVKREEPVKKGKRIHVNIRRNEE